jgi:hypothetical protein
MRPNGLKILGRVSDPAGRPGPFPSRPAVCLCSIVSFHHLLAACCATSRLADLRRPSRARQNTACLRLCSCSFAFVFAAANRNLAPIPTHQATLRRRRDDPLQFGRRRRGPLPRSGRRRLHPRLRLPRALPGKRGAPSRPLSDAASFLPARASS